MKRHIFIFSLVMLVFNFFFSNMIYALPEVSAKSAVLIEATSGRVLYEKNSHERLPQASTTKITTALLALENAQLNEKISVCENFINPGESNIYLEPGETLTLEDLLYALMLKSANDAAAVIAMGIGGSIEEFAKMMNNKMHALGLKDTNYVNPHGLHHENHYTSAYDLAMITREALKNPDFCKIINTSKYTMPWTGNEFDRVVYNRNKLLANYNGADGVKTGYTKQAGSCLVGSATKGNMQLIAVVLHDDSMYEEIVNLLDYGFNNYQLKEFFPQQHIFQEIDINGGYIEKIQVQAVKPVSYPLTEEEIASVAESIYLPSSINAPIKKGQRIGIGVIRIHEKHLLMTELIAKQEVEKRSFFSNIWAKIARAYPKKAS